MKITENTIIFNQIENAYIALQLVLNQILGKINKYFAIEVNKGRYPHLMLL